MAKLGVSRLALTMAHLAVGFGLAVGMTGAARGRVWQFNVPPEKFQALYGQWRVVHHMRVEDTIRVRCLAAESPYPGAIEVQPTLEDAYLWLLERGGGSGQPAPHAATEPDNGKETSQ